MAPVAQLAARGSHNPKVASSILAGSIPFSFASQGFAGFAKLFSGTDTGVTLEIASPIV